jgi:hypothetical protein
MHCCGPERPIRDYHGNQRSSVRLCNSWRMAAHPIRCHWTAWACRVMVRKLSVSNQAGR